MGVVETIAPIFIIILFGYIIRSRGIVREDFFPEANRFVFVLGLPFLIFLGIIKSSIKDLSLPYILCATLPSFAMFLFALAVGAAIGLKKGRLGTFVQTSFHGNVTYIGLAIIFYMLGEEGLKRGSIMIGFLIIVNNVLATVILSFASTVRRKEGFVKPLTALVKNPVIIASFFGILVLYIGIPVPNIILRCMGILANMALPLALVTIGASLSFGAARRTFGTSMLLCFLKLVILPVMSVVCLWLLKVPLNEGFPILILLATPVATLSYIMAHGMGGDCDLASNSITLSTVLSPLTYVMWALLIG